MGCLYSSHIDLHEDLTPFESTYKLYSNEFKALRLKESDVEQLYNIYDSLDDQKTVRMTTTYIYTIMYRG